VVRILVLAACWSAYVSFPLVFELFYASRVAPYPAWDEQLLHALAVLGYGTIGCWFYAITGLKGLDHQGMKRPGIFERLCMATLWSVGFFVFFLAADYS
jgi:hypothetical protein